MIVWISVILICIMVGFVSDVLDCVPFAPTAEQMDLLVGFGHFMLYGGADSVMLVNGYAGTGKTSMIGAMVKALSNRGRKAVLLAPTGHAAKVFTEYAGHGALTIHRKIFRQDGYLAEGFSVAENKHRDTIFFVDEASMISNGGEGMVFVVPRQPGQLSGRNGVFPCDTAGSFALGYRSVSSAWGGTPILGAEDSYQTVLSCVDLPQKSFSRFVFVKRFRKHPDRAFFWAAGDGLRAADGRKFAES